MADYISSEQIDKLETKIETVLDNLYILPTTKTIEVRVIDKYLDAQGKVLRSVGRKLDAIMDQTPNPEDPKDEGSTAYTDFMATAGITLENMNLAVKNFIMNREEV